MQEFCLSKCATGCAVSFLAPVIVGVGLILGLSVGLSGRAAVAGPSTAIPAAPPHKALSLCAPAIAEVERSLGIPAQLLSAIALAESGRWDSDRGKSVSYPWTVYAEGHPHYPANKKAAIAKVREIKARGVRNIDVGCMQINLFYHPEAFRNLNEAFDPAANTAYAGQLLRRLQKIHKSWSRAIAFYHSATRKYALPYLLKVQQLWLIERRREAAALRDARLESFRIKKAEREETSTADAKTTTF